MVVRDRPGLAGLSPREREVSELVAQGLTTTVIARRLGISPWTVKRHLVEVYTHLGLDYGDIAPRIALARLIWESERADPPHA